ncbi:hypothetical protein B0A48_08953 [Cryoendolithus antarcticus]|uniref:Borealin N-terminal domain-containing protein n=1 Tax=Cryoendolithus antarcticus TaxID=1507870 RepID=A0A1V8T4Z3_9PEZI|nr:hypothetical protein B0A48_08953 [Cryoendolithus antarcticus]
MPPRKQKQPQSSITAQEPPSQAPMALTSATTPPPASPMKPTMGINQAQKQAMIDNFQIEVTDRARKLRAQYAESARTLRARLEGRLNRIPPNMRKRKMQDLFDEHAEKAKPKPVALVIAAEESRPFQISSPAVRSLKRTSDHFTLDDKENQPASSQQQQPLDSLPQPKKRAKPTQAATANTKATRAVSRKGPSVLSPRSHNSRNLPKSPFKPHASPEKFYASAPMAATRSPVRPVLSTLHAPAAPSSRAPSRQAKRVVTAVEVESAGRESETSTSSAETTIVTKAAVGRNAVWVKKVGVAGAGAKSTVSAAAKRKDVATAPAPVATGRTLRKRG